MFVLRTLCFMTKNFTHLSMMFLWYLQIIIAFLFFVRKVTKSFPNYRHYSSLFFSYRTFFTILPHDIVPRCILILPYKFCYFDLDSFDYSSSCETNVSTNKRA